MCVGREHLQVFQQKNRNERCPELNAHGIGTGSDERFDFQLLFDGLEKDFDLPSIFVHLGDGG